MNEKDRFDAFTERTRRVMSLAREEARRLQHNYIGTEHLLLGLIRIEEGIAARVLRNLGADPYKVRLAVEFVVGRGDRLVFGEASLTPRAKHVIALAIEEARNLNHYYVGTEHLLLGLVRENEGIAASVLESLGINEENVRQQTTFILKQWTNPFERDIVTSRTPLTDQFSTDLTAYAHAGKLDRVIGRQQEIERMIQILARRGKNNPALIGEPGVGKTAIVEGLAQRMINGQVPEILQGKRLLMLDLSSIVAGTRYRGEFEERLKKVIEEIRASKNCIIFIDELHMLIGAGSAEGAIDASNILKPALARGEFQCIGATTFDEYRKYIGRDAALQRRFQEVMVREPTQEETFEILKGIRESYEAHHRLRITDEALQAAINLSSRYIPDRYMPDKAIDLIDEAASRVRMRHSLAPSPLKAALREMDQLNQAKDMAIQQQDYGRAAEIREQQAGLREEITRLESNWLLERGAEQLAIGEEDIAQIVSLWTGIPAMRIEQEESQRLLHMEEALHERLVGQNEAIEKIARAVRRARAGLKDPKRPIGSFIFMGPTGVGKTELARTLAEFMFGSEEALFKFDMSEFMERHAAARLVGAPPGYVGYEEGGQLTEAVRRKPYCVILLDEMEKAHPEVFNMLLQVLEDGKLTDAKGRTVDFRNTILIMTSNIGASLLNKQAAIGFRQTGNKTLAAQADYEHMKSKVLVELKNGFKPEFLNRIDEVIVFHSLGIEELYTIIDILLKRIRLQLSEHELTLEIPAATKDFLIAKGFDPEYGARPLRRTIQRMIEDQLAECLLQGKFQPGDIVECLIVDDQLVLQVKNRSKGLLQLAS